MGARLRPQLLKRLYDTDASGIQDLELCNEVGSYLYSRCRTFALVLERQVDCPQCRTVFPIATQGPSHCPGHGCDWYTTSSAYNESVKNHSAYPGRAVDAFKSFYRRYPNARTYREKMLLIDRLSHSFHVNEKTGELTKSVASKLLEGSKKAVVRFLDELSALEPDEKEKWRRTVSATIDRRMLLRVSLDEDQQQGPWRAPRDQ
jgi:hypothetical protein